MDCHGLSSCVSSGFSKIIRQSEKIIEVNITVPVDVSEKGF